MGTTAEKLSYLNGTKRLLRRRLNSLGANITLDTRFRDYLLWLNRFYDAAASAFEFEILGETTQKAINESINLYYIPDEEIVTDGITVTISEGGKITVSGTATRDVWIKLTNGMEAVYEVPITWRTSTDYDDRYGWTEEKAYELNEPAKLNIQSCHGGGTAPTGAGTASGFSAVFKYTDDSYIWYNSTFENYLNGNYNEKEVIGTATTPKDVKEINCLYLYFNQGISVNQYFWVQACKTLETVWHANNDALPASPDNPKKITNKTGDIIYKTSDGTEFLVSLGDGSPYRSVPNAGYDSITYKDGKFYNIRKTWEASLSSSNWEHYAQYNGIYRKSFNSINSKSAICNYFENVVNDAIVDFQTASDNLQHGQFALVEDNGDTYIYLKDTDFIESGDTATQFSNWVDSLYPTNIRVIYVGDKSSWIEQEITENWFSTLYPQLNAIKDYEVQCIIEDKIF